MSTVCHIVKCTCCGTLIDLLEEEVKVFDYDSDDHFCLRCSAEEKELDEG